MVDERGDGIDVLQEQRGALVGGEAAREADGEDVRVERGCSARLGDESEQSLLPGAVRDPQVFCRQLARQPELWIRVAEVKQSLSLIEDILHGMPYGEIMTQVPIRSGEALTLTEAFRGDVLVWLRVNEGFVDRCHVRDASWFQWPLLEAVIEGNIVADFPLCNKSFNCSYSGHDL